MDVRYFSDENIHPQNVQGLRKIGYKGPGWYRVTENYYLSWVNPQPETFRGILVKGGVPTRDDDVFPCDVHVTFAEDCELRHMCKEEPCYCQEMMKDG